MATSTLDPRLRTNVLSFSIVAAKVAGLAADCRRVCGIDMASELFGASVDEHLASGHEAALVRSEEEHCGGDFCGFA